MTRGKPLSDDLRGVILNMGMSQSISNIVTLTGLKHRTIERIFADYHNKGTVMREHMYRELRGPSACELIDNKFLCGLVRHSPDIYLAELQEVLEDRMGLEVWFHYEKGRHPFAGRPEPCPENGPKGNVFSFAADALHRYSMLPALAIDGMLHVKIVEGSFTVELFLIVMDNTRIHKDPEIQELIESRRFEAGFSKSSFAYETRWQCQEFFSGHIGQVADLEKPIGDEEVTVLGISEFHSPADWIRVEF
ncbi:hypothetical protein DFH08DRAFT_800091 [Mycena albidolilacea]|uniref:Uncharacterized protein n=1 Tax=Mycena albidolilacea TaxID=1033008 RepID=A0AAD7AJ83_9AGAR|nr:hypothetical protein DFH08DRAFT_800091 [Mycena albidolilacea]